MTVRAKNNVAILREFIAIADSTEAICAYSNAEETVKDRFHKLGRSIARLLADTLGMSPGTYEVRSNKAGIAVSGEIMLHGEWLYLQFAQSSMQGMGFMYRGCDGIKDYGQIDKYPNQWMQYKYLEDLDEAAKMIKSRLGKD